MSGRDRPQRNRKPTTNDAFDYRTKGHIMTPNPTTPTDSTATSPVSNQVPAPSVRKATSGRRSKKNKPEGSEASPSSNPPRPPKRLTTESPAEPSPSSTADAPNVSDAPASTADAVAPPPTHSPETVRNASNGRDSKKNEPKCSEASSSNPIAQPPPKKLKTGNPTVPSSGSFSDVLQESDEQRSLDHIKEILHKLAPLDSIPDRQEPSSSSRQSNNHSSGSVSTAAHQQPALFPVKTMKTVGPPTFGPHRLPPHSHPNAMGPLKRTQFPVARSHGVTSVRQLLGGGAEGGYRHIQGPMPQRPRNQAQVMRPAGFRNTSSASRGTPSHPRQVPSSLRSPILYSPQRLSDAAVKSGTDVQVPRLPPHLRSPTGTSNNSADFRSAPRAPPQASGTPGVKRTPPMGSGTAPKISTTTPASKIPPGAPSALSKASGSSDVQRISPVSSGTGVPRERGPSTAHVLRHLAQQLRSASVAPNSIESSGIGGAPTGRPQASGAGTSQQETPRIQMHLQSASVARSNNDSSGSEDAPMVQPQESGSSAVSSGSQQKVASPPQAPRVPEQLQTPRVQPQEVEAQPLDPIIYDQRPVKLEPIDQEYSGPNTSRDTSFSAAESFSPAPTESLDSPLMVLPTTAQGQNFPSSSHPAPLLSIKTEAPDPSSDDSSEDEGETMVKIKIEPKRFYFNAPYIEFKKSLFLIKNRSARYMAFRIQFPNMTKRITATHKEGILSPYETLHNNIICKPFELDKKSNEPYKVIISWKNVPRGQYHYTNAWFEGEEGTLGMIGTKRLFVTFSH